MTESSSSTIQPEKTPLMIGPGVIIRGHILTESDDSDLRMMILGRVEGNITTKGIVQIAKGAVVCADAVIEAGEIVVSGELIGENVTIRTNLLVLQSTGNVNVACICLPPGGLEQQRGGILNARLEMSLPARSELPAITSTIKPNSAATPFHFTPRQIGPVLVESKVSSTGVLGAAVFSNGATRPAQPTDFPTDAHDEVDAAQKLG